MDKQSLDDLIDFVCDEWAEPAASTPAEPSYQHVNKGGSYTKLGEGHLQTDEPLTDMAPLVAYRGEDGRLWFRPPAEFYSRFRATPPSAQQGVDQ